MREEHADVVVVGGGPAGASAAITLAREGLSVVVLERTRVDAPRLGETIPPDASALLHELDVWGAFVRGAHLPSPANASLWADDEMGESEFIFHPLGTGWHLDRSRFDRTLLECAQAAGARVFFSARAVPPRAPPSADGWLLECESPARRFRLRARSLIDATGRSATFARRAGARRLALDKLVAVAGYGEPVDADARTFVEATPDGWWYSARLPGDRAICVFMTDADLLPTGRLSLASYWQEQRARAPVTGARLKAAPPEALRVSPAGTARLDRAVGRGWIAVGDAVLAFDPLSSLGILKALESGRRAAQAIAAERNGDTGGVRAYLAWLDEALRSYLVSYAHYYGQVRKWPSSVFWERRRGTGLDSITRIAGQRTARW